MKCYHGTTTEAWAEIQAEGVLWGGYVYHKARKAGKVDADAYRYTYLSPEKEVAQEYAKPILLEVNYTPTGIRGIDNFGFDPPPGQTCWQFSVFVPIPLNEVKRIK